jgi:hypothetical protein
MIDRCGISAKRWSMRFGRHCILEVTSASTLQISKLRQHWLEDHVDIGGNKFVRAKSFWRDAPR